MPGAHKGPSPSPFLMQDDVVLEEHPLDEKGEEANEDLESFLEENFKEKAQGPIAGTEAIGFWWMQYVHILKLLFPEEEVAKAFKALPYSKCILICRKIIYVDWAYQRRCFFFLISSHPAPHGGVVHLCQKRWWIGGQ